MTIDEFFERLSQTPRNWFLTKTGRIRLRHEEGLRHEDWRGEMECPISAVTGKHWHFMKPSNGGNELGLSKWDTNMIVATSDNDPDTDEALREALLVACGLNEVR